MPCGWEGNPRYGVALAMRHRLQWFIHLRVHGPGKEICTPPTLLVEYGTLLRHTGRESKMLCDGVSNAKTSWQPTRNSCDRLLLDHLANFITLTFVFVSHKIFW